MEDAEVVGKVESRNRNLKKKKSEHFYLLDLIFRDILSLFKDISLNCDIKYHMYHCSKLKAGPGEQDAAFPTVCP